MQQAGICVIALGSAIFGITNPTIWVGHHQPGSYSSYPYISNGIMAVCPEAYENELLWNAGKKTFDPVRVKDCPNHMLYKTEAEFSIEEPRISDFGTESTFAVALTLAVVLGFRDILLTGVSLGGEVDSFYFYNEVPHSLVYNRKQQSYKRLREKFPEIKKQLLSRCIRLTSLDDEGLDIPVLPESYLLEHLTAPLQDLRQPDALSVMAVPADERKAAYDKQQKYARAQLTGNILYGRVDELAEKLTLDKARIKKLKATMNSKKCVGCSRKAVYGELHMLFVSKLRENPEHTEKVWEELFPDNPAVLIEGAFQIRGEAEKSGNV